MDGMVIPISITSSMSTVHVLDLVMILAFTVPPFLLFLIFTIVYFNVVDKAHKDDEEYYVNHGLSRFCLGGIFFLFGLILFDIMTEFVSAYCTMYINPDVVELVDEHLSDILHRSLIFNGIGKAYKAVPTSILINFTIICTAIYTSTEGLIASLKTLKLEEGLAVELPAVKRRRLAIMFVLWGYLSVIATLYTFLVGSDKVKFDLPNIYVSVGLTLVILFMAERSPSLLKDKTTGAKIVKTAENVAHAAPTQTIAEAEYKPIIDEDATVADHVSKEHLDAIVAAGEL